MLKSPYITLVLLSEQLPGRENTRYNRNYRIVGVWLAKLR